MRKAFYAAKLSLSLYLRSGKVVLPLLAMLAFLLVFYHVRPFNVVGSYSISFITMFAIAMWFGISLAWSEEPRLAQILSVKVGMLRFLIAQQLLTNVLVASCSTLFVLVPAVENLFLPDFFIRTLTAFDVLSASCLHICAAMCGCSVGLLFHPRLIGDRKIAFILCILIGLLSFISGGLGIPYAARFLLPPVFDSLYQTGSDDTFTLVYVALYSTRFLIYGLICSGVQVVLLNKKKF